jgi:predicted nucleic acid-binding protein
VILLDTSGLLAALFSDQRHHQACARALREAEPPLLLSPFVLAEADYLIHKYGGLKAELLFLAEVGRGAYDLEPFGDWEVESAREVVKKYSNLEIGLADASIVVLADQYNCDDVLTLDHRHFRTIRRSGRQTFRVLPAVLGA